MAGKIFKYLPKSTSFSIPTSNKTNVHRANFSGPIVSIIPEEARRTKRSDDRNNSGFESQEPTSPKVTCMGQVKKHKKHDKKNKKKTEREEVQSKKSGIRGMFQKKVRPGRPPVAEAMMEKAPMMRRCTSGWETAAEVALDVGTMRKFASGREALADFDWRKYAVEEEGEEVIVAHSAPLVMGGVGVVEKRAEINLWKRRTLAPPEPLQLKQAKVFN